MSRIISNYLDLGITLVHVPKRRLEYFKINLLYVLPTKCSFFDVVLFRITSVIVNLFVNMLSVCILS